MNTEQVENLILSNAKFVLKNRETTPIALAREQRQVKPADAPRHVINSPEGDTSYGDGLTATIYEDRVVVDTYEAVRFVLSNIERVPDERTRKIKRLSQEVEKLKRENRRLKRRCEELGDSLHEAMKLPSVGRSD